MTKASGPDSVKEEPGPFLGTGVCPVYNRAVLETGSTPRVSCSVLPPWLEEAQGQG